MIDNQVVPARAARKFHICFPNNPDKQRFQAVHANMAVPCEAQPR